MPPPHGQLADRLCPRTGEPCTAGRPADCVHFWECVRKALEQQDAGDEATRGASAAG